MLHQLQNSEIGSCEHFDENYPKVLPLKLYLNLEKRRKAKREEEAKQNSNLGDGVASNEDKGGAAAASDTFTNSALDGTAKPGRKGLSPS